MDDRVRRHAEILVDHCTNVTAGDDVLVKAPTVAEDLVVALYEKLGERGARPTTVWRNPRASREYLRAMDPGEFTTSDRALAAMENTDVVVLVGGGRNAAETSDVDPEVAGAASRANRPVLEERLDTRWVITRHPTTADAQRAGTSTAAWTDLFYEAVDRDWAAQQSFQRRLVDLLEPADEVRIRSGERTDVRLSVDGMGVYDDDATENLPGGEVATVPVLDGVDGTVVFDLPVTYRGREIRNARLELEDGEVVDYAAGRNEAALAGLLETDAGSSRVGELGVGTNRGIDRATGITLLDEKMGDTVHLALGSALKECVPEDREANESAVHVDLLLDVSEDASIKVDGTTIQRDGTFRFEEGFEA